MKERHGSEPHFTVLCSGGKMTQVDIFCPIMSMAQRCIPKFWENIFKRSEKREKGNQNSNHGGLPFLKLISFQIMQQQVSNNWMSARQFYWLIIIRLLMKSVRRENVFGVNGPIFSLASGVNWSVHHFGRGSNISAFIRSIGMTLLDMKKKERKKHRKKQRKKEGNSHRFRLYVWLFCAN